jgi:YbgC/YbaW family acyl-CoA thioester hydrolase
MIDTDASGRIHYTAMFRYYEAAEMEFLRTLGVTYTDCNTCNLPRVHVECDFLRVIKLDDEIDIEVSITSVGRSSFRLEFQTFDAAELAAKGAVVVACVDRRTLGPAPIPDDLRARLCALVTEPRESRKREKTAPAKRGCLQA